MAEEIKKGLEEIGDDELDMVAGGVYTPEEWAAMTPTERAAARRESTIAVAKGGTCKYYEGREV